MITDKAFAPKLTEIFRDVLDQPDLVLQDDLRAADVETWDSLSHIDLIHAIEKAFKVRFTTAEVTKLRNVGELGELLERKLA